MRCLRQVLREIVEGLKPEIDVMRKTVGRQRNQEKYAVSKLADQFVDCGWPSNWAKQVAACERKEKGLRFSADVGVNIAESSPDQACFFSKSFLVDGIGKRQNNEAAECLLDGLAETLKELAGVGLGSKGCLFF